MCIINIIKSSIVLNGRCCCQKLKSIYKKVILVFDLQKIIHHVVFLLLVYLQTFFMFFCLLNQKFWSLSLAIKTKEQNTKCFLFLLLDSREHILFNFYFIFVYFTCLIKYVFHRNHIIPKGSDLIFSQSCEKKRDNDFFCDSFKNIQTSFHTSIFIVNKTTGWCSHGLGAFTVTLLNALFHWNAWNFICMRKLNVLAKTLVELNIQMNKFSNQRKMKSS